MENIWDRVEDEDEEALSLSDLPLIQKKDEQEIEEGHSLPKKSQIPEEFDFCSFAKESEMCTADEVFFRGRILPLRRHSVSSDKGLALSNPTRPISRSESMDRFYSGGLISSRSSSIGSHQSSSSGSSVSNPSGPKFKPRFNQFHSHPSPSPRGRFPGNKPGPIPHRNSNFTKKSSIWNVFRLGLVTPPPEIAFQDLKSRCPSNVGSRNSTNSSVSSSKRKAKALLVGGCRCSSDAVATAPTRVVTIRRSASEGSAARRRPVEPERIAPSAKKQLSHHRTFEWIKQLSLEGAPDEA